LKISELWLREWVNPVVSRTELAVELTMAGLEVEGVYPVAASFQGVIVAHVVTTAPHPNADKLTLCQVDAGTLGILPVVCGAANVRPGLKVALARVGAELPNQFIIKSAKLRGEASEGMLCSTSELGFEDCTDGILELPADAPIGEDLRTYFSLDDACFDINLTPNRADCLSVLGVAREVAAKHRLPIQYPLVPELIVTAISTPSIHIATPSFCPRYCGRVIRGLSTHVDTPLWMKERLRRASIRSIHPVVDVMNYVMMEYGQPMHAFDLRQLNGTITVREAQIGETLTLLDEKTVTLDPKTVVIADDEKPLAIAGIMGGLSSAVSVETTDVFLECAFFTPQAIAGVARKYGLCTDSSQRFERGVDPALQGLALARATDLLLNILGGEAGPVVELCAPEYLPSMRTIPFRPAKVTQMTGVLLDDATCFELLTALGLEVDRSHPLWQVNVPTYRFDLALEVDLVEEVIRLYGYDQLDTGSSLLTGPSRPVLKSCDGIGQYFSSRGYHEMISYSFVDPMLQSFIYPDDDGMTIVNPISAELSVMRQGLWPGLLSAMVYNHHRQQATIQLFEQGVVFKKEGAVVREVQMVGGLLSGVVGHLNWAEPTRSYDFFDLKGDVTAWLMMQRVVSIAFKAEPHPALHPGQSAAVIVNGEAVGFMGLLHPQLAESLDLDETVFLFEISLDKLLSHRAHFEKISKYPQIRRDLSLRVPSELPVSCIQEAISQVIPAAILKSIDVFDVYQGAGIPPDQKSIGVALTLQDAQGTLVDETVLPLIDAVLEKLQRDFSISLRDS